jgi:hypothetical protein
MTDASRAPESGTGVSRSDGVPTPDVHGGADEYEPDTQGSDPLDAALGEDGQGDVLAEDDPLTSDHGGGPDDLRTEDPAQARR